MKSCETRRCVAETQLRADEVILLAQLVFDCADWRNEVIRHKHIRLNHKLPSTSFLSGEIKSVHVADIE